MGFQFSMISLFGKKEVSNTIEKAEIIETPEIEKPKIDEKTVNPFDYVKRKTNRK